MESREQNGISLKDTNVFEQLFRQHYAAVCQTIYRYVPDRSRTEDVAQEMFAELWNKRDQIMIHTSPGAYLHRMAVSRALNYLRDSKKYIWDDIDDPDTSVQAGAVAADVVLQLEEAELRQTIDLAISALPEKCRIVFQLSRSDQMSYAEIGQHLGISVKTVENQIGKALRMLRQALQKDRG